MSARVLAAVGLVSLIASLASAALLVPQSRKGKPVPNVPTGVKATVADLAFLTGSWEFRKGADYLEEHWGEPRGDCMLGSFRWLRKGQKAWMYELLTMRNESDGVTLRFRHFNDQLACWEKDPICLRLVALEGQQAVFRHFGGDGKPWTMTFHRLGPDSLSITIRPAGATEGGQVFAYRRPGKKKD